VYYLSRDGVKLEEGRTGKKSKISFRVGGYGSARNTEDRLPNEDQG